MKRGPEDAFVALQDEAKRCKGLQCAIWRKEVTKKGVPHYHLAVWVTEPSKALEVWCWLTQRWVHHLLRDGVCPGVAYLSGSKAFKRRLPTSPDSWTYFGRAALEHVNCRFNLRSRVDKGNLVELNLDSAIQYLCDHTSKHKAYQAKTTGRAWGIWKRSFLPRMVVPGVSLENCPLACSQIYARPWGRFLGIGIRSRAPRSAIGGAVSAVSTPERKSFSALVPWMPSSALFKPGMRPETTRGPRMRAWCPRRGAWASRPSVGSGGPRPPGKAVWNCVAGFVKAQRAVQSEPALLYYMCIFRQGPKPIDSNKTIW